MLNANYISLFGMPRHDILIRQKFLNDLRDLEEINNCFKHPDSSEQQQQQPNDPLNLLLQPRKINKQQQKPLNLISPKKDLVAKLPKLLNSNQQFAERLKNLELKKSPKKEFAKHNLEKKTNTNVYFWYYKESDTEQVKNRQPNRFGFKLPNLTNTNSNNNNNNRIKKRKDSLSSDLTSSTQSFKIEENVLNAIEEHVQPIVEEIMNKKPDGDLRPIKSPTESIHSLSSSADIRTINKKKRVILKTAQLKQLNISPQFIEDAKKMVFLPACNSFHPIEVSKYVSDNKHVNNEYGYDRFQ